MVIHPLTISIEPPELFRAISTLPGAFFLDTGQPGGGDQFSFMGFQPRMQLRISDGGKTWLDGKPIATPASPLEILEGALEPPKGATRPRRIPFAGGLIVGVAYEAKNWIETLPDPAHSEPDLPLVIAALYDAVIAYSHSSGSYALASWHLMPAALRKRGRDIERLARRVPSAPIDPRQGGSEATPPVANMDSGQYLAKVHRIKDYIARGDVYQVNLSQRFRTRFSGAPADLYYRMRHSQPVPFGFFTDWGDFQTAANSPERFLRREGQHLITCPIKGTRGRTAAADDAAAVAALRGDAKEAAEHVMIVDVERNDLGRVCDTGSVRVYELARPRIFSTLYHLESVIGGRLREGTPLSEVLRATFPSGSVTGAPKIRAMEIIAELEPEQRGLYTGALGYLDHSGDLDLAMAIRTVTSRDGVVSYSAGGGIVADSVPELEYEECLIKARSFFAGLGGTPTFDPGPGAPRSVRRSP